MKHRWIPAYPVRFAEKWISELLNIECPMSKGRVPGPAFVIRNSLFDIQHSVLDAAASRIGKWGWRLERIQSLGGFLAFAVLAWLISENRKKVDFRAVVSGMALQILIALILLKLPGIQSLFVWLNRGVEALEESTRAGTGFVFGYLGGGTLPFVEKAPGMSYVLACRALPLVILMSALSSLFFYWRILPLLVRGFSWVLRRTMGLGGVEGLSTAANVFVGMVEAPLLVRPYLNRVSRSEMFTIMTGGMAGIAGTVLVLYASFLANRVPNILAHLLIASLISAPAAVAISKLMIPETERLSGADVRFDNDATSAMDAITVGTVDGMKLLINIVAMLIVLVALVHLFNMILSLLPRLPEGEPITLQGVLGWVMSPIAWLVGVPWTEAGVAGRLLGIKTILNELLAYVDMSQLPEGALSERSRVIMVYALCGFANLGSLGIMIGGMGLMAPDRRGEIVSMGFKSIVAGTIATCMTGAAVGILI
jgi:concentrative nucleoside transporter, CNT family